MTEDLRDTEPPTATDHEAPVGPYTGEPPVAVLTEIHSMLTSPDGELANIRKDMAEISSALQRREKTDERRVDEDKKNWDFIRHELQQMRLAAGRIEEKLDKVETRVTDVETKVTRHEHSIEDIKKRLAALESTAPKAA